MKSIIISALVLLALSVSAKPKFRINQLVYWSEVDQNGNSIVAVGRILQGKRHGTYRILTTDGWKMHLKP